MTVVLTETEAGFNCGPEAVQQLKMSSSPLRVYRGSGQPDDAADVVGLLCGADAWYITGPVISDSGSCVKIYQSRFVDGAVIYRECFPAFLK